MDPKACYEMMLDCAHSDTYAYNELKHDLVQWFRNGGFGFDAQLTDGRKVFVLSLNYCGDMNVRFGNGRRKVVRMSEVCT